MIGWIMFKGGDIVVLSFGGKKYLREVCPSILDEWSNYNCTIKFSEYEKKYGGMRAVLNLGTDRWINANPEWFDLELEYEWVDCL